MHAALQRVVELIKDVEEWHGAIRTFQAKSRFFRELRSESAPDKYASITDLYPKRRVLSNKQTSQSIYRVRGVRPVFKPNVKLLGHHRRYRVRMSDPGEIQDGLKIARPVNYLPAFSS